MSDSFCSSLFFGWMYAIAISHSCQTDICSTVRRFSRLLLHNSVMSLKNNFFTSSSCSFCFDCLISVATTLRITRNKQIQNQNGTKTMELKCDYTWILETKIRFRFRMSSVQNLLTNMFRHYFIEHVVRGQREAFLVEQQALR